jgi:alkyl sulfatase BDS1-like metallo-beta-lactamase superfamily hydrolase
MTQTTRLWELSSEIQQLEDAIAIIQEDDSLTDDNRETKLQETFDRWLSTGKSFKVKAEQVAAYIRHQETLAEARKAEARRIRTLAEQAENSATRLRHYLTNEMLRSGVDRIDATTTKISLRKKQPRVMLNVDPSELPIDYVKVTYEPKLTKIKELLKVDAQGAIGWAFIAENHEYSVTIR